MDIHTAQSYWQSIRSYFSYENETTINKIKKEFPGALTNKDLVYKVQEALQIHGFEAGNTLLATSFCSDELNRSLEDELRTVYGPNFNLGGLSGFAFGGVTAFSAMARHIPLNDSNPGCFIVYGPHVGIDANGVVGKVNRVGMTNESTSPSCCGSAADAALYVEKVINKEIEPQSVSNTPNSFVIDGQQPLVRSSLLKYGNRLKTAVDKDVELPKILFDAQDEVMKKVVKGGCVALPANARISLMGGIQINTPPGTSDYFLPLLFEVRSHTGELLENLMDYVHVHEEFEPGHHDEEDEPARPEPTISNEDTIPQPQEVIQDQV